MIPTKGGSTSLHRKLTEAFPKLQINSCGNLGWRGEGLSRHI